MTSGTSSPFDLSGKRVLVTGASSGLGRQIAICASELGARLILSGRNSARLDETRALLAPGEHVQAAFDMTDTAGLSPWLEGLGRVGAIDALVHSAGLQVTKPIKALGLAEFEDLMRINVTGALALAQAFRKKNVRGPEAAIVFISSIMGLVGESGLTAYCTSKAALGGLVRSLAVELARERVRVNCVAPGHVQSATGMSAKVGSQLTEHQLEALEHMHPLGLGRPEDVAHAVMFLIAPTGRWITGTTLVVDGGYTAR